MAGRAGDEPSAAEVVARLENLWDSSPARPAGQVPVLVPDRLDHYRIERVVGAGSFGIVCLAWDERLLRKVALKIPRPEVLADEERLMRFEAEARAAAALDHPGIVPILEANLDGPLPYIASAYCDGPDLAEWTASLSEPVAFRVAAQLIARVAEAIAHAHQHGVYHRDLKPSNVMLAVGRDWTHSKPSEHALEPRITDFGLAKLAEAGLYETRSSILVGTPMYMPPEKLRGNVPTFAAAADIYALGVMLFELVAGRTPFEGESYYEIVARIAREDPPRLRSLRLATPRDLETICLKCLEKDPWKRYASAELVADDLERYLAHRPIVARPVGAATRAWRWCERNRVVAGLSSLVMALLLAAVAGSVLVAFREAGLRRHADFQAGRAEQALLEADTSAIEAAEQRNEAVLQRNTAQLNQYHADMTGGMNDWDAGNLARLDATLMNHLPRQGEPDRRGWEWYYLLSLCHPEEYSFYHNGNVASIDWSPDGKLLASTGYFGSAKIWDTDTGDLIREIDESSVMKRGAAWSPDGNRLAWGTTAALNRVFIWDRRTDEVQELNGHTFSLASVDWHPDGRRLLSASYDETLKIWDTSTGGCERTITWWGDILQAKWSPNTAHISLITHGPEPLKILDAASGEMVHRGAKGASRVDWAPDGKHLAVGGKNGWFLLAADSWEVVKQSESKHDVRSIACSPDGMSIACGDSNGMVRLIDVERGVEVKSIRAHQGAITDVTWHPNNGRVATAGADGKVKLWQLEAFEQPRNIRTPSAIQRFQWKDDRTIETVHHYDGDAVNWDAISLEQVSASRREGTTMACRSYNGDWLAELSASNELPAQSVRISNAEQTVAFVAATGFEKVTHFDWSPDNRLLAIGGEFPKPPLQAKDDSGTKGRREQEVTLPAGVEFWDVGEEQKRWEWANQMTAGRAWSPDGSQYLIAAIGEPSDGGAVLWSPHLYVLDADQRQQVAKFRHRNQRDAFVKSVCWSPDGRFVVGGDMNGFVEVRDLHTGQVVMSTRVHQQEVRCLAWSPDGQRLATGSLDRTAKILLPSTGRELLVFPRLANHHLQRLSWSSSGKRLAGHAPNGLLYVWDAGIGYRFAGGDASRGHLAQAHLAQARSDTTEQCGYHMQQALQHAPKNSEYRAFRGNLFAAMGDFASAAAEFEACPNHGPDIATLKALAYAGTGDLDRMAADCESLLNQYEHTDDVVAASRVLQVCNLLPRDTIDRKRVLRLAEKVLETMTPGFTGETLVAEAHYRLGNFKVAKDWLSEILKSKEVKHKTGDPGQYRTAELFLCMACFQLGDRKQATELWERLRQQSDTTVSRLAIEAWRQRVILGLLQEEVNKLIVMREAFLRGEGRPTGGHW